MRRIVLLSPLLSLLVLALPACSSRTADRWASFEPHETHVYREIAGTSLEMHVFRPASPDATTGAEPSLRPAVLFFHGGSWTRGRPRRFYPHAQELAARGMVGLSASYRLQGTHGTGVPEAIEDAKAAYAWLLANAEALGVDRDRIVVAGGSAGGHLAAAVALMAPVPPVPPVALVLYNPALDIRPEDFPGWVRWFAEPALEELFGGRYRELSPAHYVKPGAPPTALFHGTDDSIVPIEHSRAFCERMIAVASPCVLHEYPGAEHGSFNFGWGVHYEDAVLKTALFLQQMGLVP